jgi:hypothetical protein
LAVEKLSAGDALVEIAHRIEQTGRYASAAVGGNDGDGLARDVLLGSWPPPSSVEDPCLATGGDHHGHGAPDGEGAGEEDSHHERDSEVVSLADGCHR